MIDSIKNKDIEGYGLTGVAGFHVPNNRMLTVLVLFLAFFYPISDFGISKAVGFMMLSICWIACVVLWRFQISFTISKISLYYLLLVVALVFAYSMPFANHSSWQIVAANILCVVFVLTAKPSKVEILKVERLLIVTGLIFAVYIIFCRFNFQFYCSNILPYLKGIGNEALDSNKKGYGIALGGYGIYGDYFLSFTSFLALAKLRMEKKNIYRILYSGCIFVYTTAIVLEGRRGELLTFIGCMFFLVALLYNGKQAKVIIRKIVLIAFATVIFIYVLRFLDAKGLLGRYVSTIEAFERNLSIDDTFDAVSSSRNVLWEVALSSFKEHPLFGIGWGNFVHEVESFSKVTNVHNTYLQYLCEIGIVGTVTFLVPIFAVFVQTIRTTRSVLHTKDDPIKVVACSSSIAMQLYFFIINFLDPAFFRHFGTIIFAISVIFINWINHECSS